MGASPGKHDAERPRRPRAMLNNSSSSSTATSSPKIMEDAHELSVGEVRLFRMGHQEKNSIDHRSMGRKHIVSSPSGASISLSLSSLRFPSSLAITDGEPQMRIRDPLPSEATVGKTDEP